MISTNNEFIMAGYEQKESSMPRKPKQMSAETQGKIQEHLDEIGALCAAVFTPVRVTLLVRHPTRDTDFLFVGEDDLDAVIQQLTLIRDELDRRYAD